jgi:Purine-cytosine permease and related proteins
MYKDGIEQVPKEYRKGSPFNQFTLWFAANLTLADFAIGFIPLFFNLSIYYSFLGIILGTLLGSLVVAIFSTMGPGKGKTQMMISGDTFKRSNFIFSFFQGISSLGWFTVNLIPWNSRNFNNFQDIFYTNHNNLRDHSGFNSIFWVTTIFHKLENISAYF